MDETLKKVNSAHDTLKVSYETIKTKNEVTLVEREKEISALQQ